MSLTQRAILRGLAICCSLLILSSCRQSTPVEVSSDVDQIVIRMAAPPETLSPILAETSLSREAYQYLFLTLAGYDYQTLELKPVLIESLPDGEKISSGQYDGAVAYKMNMRQEAVWNNGAPVTGHDVLFTYKMALHPGVITPGWKQLLNEMVDIVVDADDPQSFTIYTSDTYFLNREAMLSTEIYPKHVFDPSGVMDDVAYTDMKIESTSKGLKEDEEFMELAKQFSSVTFSKEKVEGAGPYNLEKWETGQYLVLKRKDNYWGEQIENIDHLHTYPNRMIFQFIRDEATAFTLLKNDEIDIIDFSRAPVTQYEELKKDEAFNQKYVFKNAQLQRYYYLLFNNEDSRLSDVNVRKAMARLIDVDRLVTQLEGGYASRMNTILHFTKPEYNKNLDFINYNAAGASALLQNAGWVDTDDNGIRDKVINGRKEELSFRFHITGSSFSTSVSSIFKEACANAGIEISIIEKPWNATKTENLVTGDYDMLVSARTQSPVQSDPYILYHSSQVGTSGSNYTRYSNPEADELMEFIRTTKDNTARIKTYMDLQAIIHEDQPAVFLYSPQLRIIHDKNISPVISSNRPGYFVNEREAL